MMGYKPMTYRFILALSGILSVFMTGNGTFQHSATPDSLPGQKMEPPLNICRVEQRILPIWFSMEEQIFLSHVQRERLWQSLAEVLQLYAEPSFERFERYLHARKGQLRQPEKFYQEWQKHYERDQVLIWQSEGLSQESNAHLEKRLGVWEQLLGRGAITVYQSEQPVTSGEVLKFIMDQGSHVALGLLRRFSTFPGESARPCLYARAQFIASPPPLLPKTPREYIEEISGMRLVWPVSDAPRTYVLWLRWDIVTEQWWLDAVGVDEAGMRPAHYDPLF